MKFDKSTFKLILMSSQISNHPLLWMTPIVASFIHSFAKTIFCYIWKGNLTPPQPAMAVPVSLVHRCRLRFLFSENCTKNRTTVRNSLKWEFQINIYADLPPIHRSSSLGLSVRLDGVSSPELVRNVSEGRPSTTSLEEF